MCYSQFSVAQPFQCVRENWILGEVAEQTSQKLSPEGATDNSPAL